MFFGGRIGIIIRITSHSWWSNNTADLQNRDIIGLRSDCLFEFGLKFGAWNGWAKCNAAVAQVGDVQEALLALGLTTGLEKGGEKGGFLV